MTLIRVRKRDVMNVDGTVTARWTVRPPQTYYVTHHSTWADAMRQCNELLQHPTGSMPVRLIYGFSESEWKRAVCA